MNNLTTKAVFAASIIGITISSVHAQLGLQLVAGGFSQPLFATSPVGDNRVFVVDKTGQIEIIQGGVRLPTPFLDLSGVINATGEQGLLGLAFDPNFATNRQFYVNYIAAGSQDTVVRRYTAPTATSNVADANSGQTIITIDQPTGRTNHKAGWIGFRPQDTANLYVAVGDGGSGNDPDGNGQNINTNLGKMLRLNVSGGTAGYSIPAGNPFAGTTPGNDEIWAYGLRNPFRNSFDRLTGDFYIADVGQGTQEEVDFEAAPAVPGRNYGWRSREGSGDNPDVADPAPGNATDPIYSYPRLQGSSITGGYVYRGSKIPELYGKYIFADFVRGDFGVFTVTNGVAGPVTDVTNQLDPNNINIGPGAASSFGEDAFGNLYVTDIAGGQVYVIVPEPASAMSLLACGLLAMRRARRTQ